MEDDEMEGWTPEGLAAWNRSMAEIERRSRGAIEGMRAGRDATMPPAEAGGMGAES
jgi:hypothetical protein